MNSNAPVLNAEDRNKAERLYRAVFRASPPPIVIERFLDASALLNASASEEERVAYRRALARGGDLEALEVAARYRRRLRLLTDHVRLMVYLAEAEPGNQHHFVKRHPSRFAAAVAIGGGACKTAYKLAKGMLILSRVDHV